MVLFAVFSLFPIPYPGVLAAVGRLFPVPYSLLRPIPPRGVAARQPIFAAQSPDLVPVFGAAGREPEGAGGGPGPARGGGGRRGGGGGGGAAAAAAAFAERSRANPCPTENRALRAGPRAAAAAPASTVPAGERRRRSCTPGGSSGSSSGCSGRRATRAGTAARRGTCGLRRDRAGSAWSAGGGRSAAAPGEFLEGNATANPRRRPGAR